MFIYDAVPFQLHLCASCNCIFASGEPATAPISPSNTYGTTHSFLPHGILTITKSVVKCRCIIAGSVCGKQFSFQLNGGINVCDVAP